MAGVPFISKILALAGMTFRKNSSNRQASLDISPAQANSTNISLNLPAVSGNLIVASEAVLQTEKGVANGVATLGSDGLVPYSQLPEIPGISAPIDFQGSVINDQTSGTVFRLPSSAYKGFIAQVSVFIEGSSSESFTIVGANNGVSWLISPTSAGNNSGVSFSMSSAGVLSFSDSAVRQKSIAYSVQAISTDLESHSRSQVKGSFAGGAATNLLFTVDSLLYKSFVSFINIFFDHNESFVSEIVVIQAAYDGSDWITNQISAGETTGISIAVSSTGEVSYTGPSTGQKTITYQYETTGNFIGKNLTSNSSGSIATVDSSLFRGFTAQVSVVVSSSPNVAETFYIIATNNDSDWLMSYTSAGDDTGVEFTISSSGVLSFSDPGSQEKLISYRINPMNL